MWHRYSVGSRETLHDAAVATRCRVKSPHEAARAHARRLQSVRARETLLARRIFFFFPSSSPLTRDLGVGFPINFARQRSEREREIV